MKSFCFFARVLVTCADFSVKVGTALQASISSHKVTNLCSLSARNMVLQVIDRVVNEHKSESQVSNHDESRIRETTMNVIPILFLTYDSYLPMFFRVLNLCWFLLASGGANVRLDSLGEVQKKIFFDSSNG